MLSTALTFLHTGLFASTDSFKTVFLNDTEVSTSWPMWPSLVRCLGSILNWSSQVTDLTYFTQAAPHHLIDLAIDIYLAYGWHIYWACHNAFCDCLCEGCNAAMAFSQNKTFCTATQICCMDFVEPSSLECTYECCLCRQLTRLRNF